MGGYLDFFDVEGFGDIQFMVGTGMAGKISGGDRFAVRIPGAGNRPPGAACF